MKKFLLTLLIFSAVGATTAQTTIQAGAFGMAETPWILNSNVTAADATQDYDFTIRPAFGVNAGFYFSETVGVEVEVIARKLEQKWKGELDGGLNYNSSIEMSSLDLPLLLKLGNKAYFEIGPQIGLLSGHKYNINVEGLDVVL